jgi:hypothetical protein
MTGDVLKKKKKLQVTVPIEHRVDTALLRALAYLLHRIADEILRIIG